jgi:hypothetical protein
MTKWIVVWVSASESLLCKWYGDHYEVEAKSGESQALKDIAGKLNGADA